MRIWKKTGAEKLLESDSKSIQVYVRDLIMISQRHDTDYTTRPSWFPERVRMSTRVFLHKFLHGNFLLLVKNWTWQEKTWQFLPHSNEQRINIAMRKQDVKENLFVCIQFKAPFARTSFSWEGKIVREITIKKLKAFLLKGKAGHCILAFPCRGNIVRGEICSNGRQRNYAKE